MYGVQVCGAGGCEKYNDDDKYYCAFACMCALRARVGAPVITLYELTGTQICSAAAGFVCSI